MVPRSRGDERRRSKRSSHKKRPLAPNLQPSRLLPFLGDPPADRLEALQYLHRKSGLGRKASQTVSDAQKPSTIRLYQSRWSIFRRWCAQKDVSAFEISIPLLLDFYIFLFEDVGLAYSTVVGYRASLKDIALALEIPVDSHYLVSRLFQHYQKAVPKRKVKTPGWNLNLVLDYLKGPRFEPLREANLKDLTLKTAFLVCFALAARICEVQGLSGNVCLGKRGISAVLTYDDRFWLKMEDTLREVKREIEIPGLYNIATEREELLLCPVRALKYYLQRKDSLGADKSRLFVAPSNVSRPASINGLTHLLKGLIKAAHRDENLPGDLGIVTGMTVREIRGIASSLNFITTNSFKDLQNAALWKNNTVFAGYYLRERGEIFYQDGIYRLRPPPMPVVAAQTVLPGLDSALKRVRAISGSPGPSDRGTSGRKDTWSKVKSSRGKTSQSSSH